MTIGTAHPRDNRSTDRASKTPRNSCHFLPLRVPLRRQGSQTTTTRIDIQPKIGYNSHRGGGSMAKRSSPSGELAVFRSRPPKKPSILDGFLCWHVALSLSPPTLKEVP